MKTALTILAGVLATLVIAVIIFYVGWLSPPSPDSVCDNVERIALEQRRPGDDPPPHATSLPLRTECVARATTAPEFGRAVWVKQLECMRDAVDMAGLTRCEDIRSI